jgi:ABC-2 type transport system ATP-binding protein
MIQTSGLVKRYGAHAALDGVDLRVPAGSVYGLAGPNGAGKTTLLGILAGLKESTEGEVTVAVKPGEVAVLPDTPRFDPWLTGREVVALALTLGSAGGTRDARRDADRVDEVLSQSGLSDSADRRCGGFSRGMLQRLGIACTLVARPTLILLDEPASALDPQGRREVLDLIATLRGQATVLFSSHILGDVQEVCDAVGILHQGRLLFQGPLSDLLVGHAVPRYIVRLRTKADADAVAAALAVQPWVHAAIAAGGAMVQVEVATLGDAERLLPGALAATGVPVVSLAPEAVSLERAFLELTS